MLIVELKHIRQSWIVRTNEDNVAACLPCIAQYHMTQPINAVLQLGSSTYNPIETNLSQLAQSEILFIYVVHANRDGTQYFYKGNWKPRQGIGRGGVRTKRAQRRSGFMAQREREKLTRRLDQGQKSPIPNFISARDYQSTWISMLTEWMVKHTSVQFERVTNLKSFHSWIAECAGSYSTIHYMAGS
jgi:hypothetical protein